MFCHGYRLCKGEWVDRLELLHARCRVHVGHCVLEGRRPYVRFAFRGFWNYDVGLIVMSPTNSLERHRSSRLYDQEINEMAIVLPGVRNAARCGDTTIDGVATASLNDSGRGRFGVTPAGDLGAGGILLFGGGEIGDPLNGTDSRVGAISKWSYATPEMSGAAISSDEYISVNDDSVTDGPVRFGRKNCGAFRRNTLTTSESISTADVVLNNEGERPNSWPLGMLRIGASLAGDSMSEALVFFGGDMSSELSVGIRIGDGATSARSHKLVATSNANPSSRRGTSIALDSASEELVFFGGDMSSELSVGIRIGDGATSARSHKLVATSNANPSSRRGTSIALDSASEELVFFGGVSSDLFVGPRVWGSSPWSEVVDVNVSRFAGPWPPDPLDLEDVPAADDRTFGELTQVGGAFVTSHSTFHGVRINAAPTIALSSVPRMVSSGLPASLDGGALPTVGVAPLVSVFPYMVGVTVPSSRTGTALMTRSIASALTAGLANSVTITVWSAWCSTATGATPTAASSTFKSDFGPRFTRAISFDAVLSATNFECHFSTGEDPIGDVTPGLNYSGVLCSETAALKVSSGDRHGGIRVGHQ
jgi:hypothetical protein